MIARLGYVVFAEDIYGKTVRPKTVPEMSELSGLYNKDRPLMRARAQAGLDVLRQNSMVDPAKIAVVGYCFGGTVAVELIETGAPLAASVAVHGSFRNFARRQEHRGSHSDPARRRRRPAPLGRSTS